MGWLYSVNGAEVISAFVVLARGGEPCNAVARP
jgi:hypothetical protein